MRISGRVKFPRDNLIWDTKQNYFLPHLENLICKHVQSVEPEYNELHTALYTGIEAFFFKVHALCVQDV
jgi:hypothetical protein